MHALIFGGKIIAYPAVDWQATGGEKLFANYNVFSFPSPILLYFFLCSNTMSTLLKVKRNTWSMAEEKDFLLLYVIWNAIYNKKIICKYEEEHKYSH